MLTLLIIYIIVAVAWCMTGNIKIAKAASSSKNENLNGQNFSKRYLLRIACKVFFPVSSHKVYEKMLQYLGLKEWQKNEAKQ